MTEAETMKDILDFAGEHPVVAVLALWAICELIKAPFWYAFRAYKQTLRVRSIALHGWPTAPVDADGDVVPKRKKHERIGAAPVMMETTMFRMLKPNEVEGWPSDFKLGDKVTVHMPPWDAWDGDIVRLKWFTGDRPGSEPIYEVKSPLYKTPTGYSGHWLKHR